MKPLLLALLVLCSFHTFALADAPVIKAAEAAAIAQADLAARGLEATVFITELVFKDAKLLGEPAHWAVLWSKEFDAQTEGRKEIGLKVKMDGTYARSVR